MSKYGPTGLPNNIDIPLQKKKIRKGGLVPLQIPKIPIYLNVRQYLLSKAHCREVRKLPSWDVSFGTPATELARANRMFYDTNERLVAKREQYKIRRCELDAKWELLRKKQTDLRASFLRFNAFTKENEDKRERADRRIREEEIAHETRDKNNNRLQTEVDQMNSIKELMEKYVSMFKFYEDYLASVVNTVSEFKEIRDLLNRYETLAGTRSELADRQVADLESLEFTRTRMIHVTEEKANALVSFNTKMAELQSRFEKSRINALRWESAMARVKSISAKKLVEMKLVKDSAWTMYNAICIRKGIRPTIDLDDTGEQLMYIKSTMLDLKKIIKIAKKRASRELQTTVPLSRAPVVAVIKITSENV